MHRYYVKERRFRANLSAWSLHKCIPND